MATKQINLDETQVGAGGSPPGPYTVDIRIRGVSPILFHRWSVEGVEAKAAAPKGSAEKKTDDWESYLYRDADGMICIPTEYLRMACIEAARYRQDPRSPRKSARDLYKAGLVSITDLVSTGVKEPDYLDRRRACVMRAGVTRTRPALSAGWECSFTLMVQVPEYIPPETLATVVSDAGRLSGLGDFRPSYGRFVVTGFTVLD